MGKVRCFNKVMIANRGEIALRVLRCLQDMAIPSVIIYHKSDNQSPAVKLADEAVEIIGDSANAAYLDIEQIVSICQRLGIDAVHPGYGFLAESATFAQALETINVCFIGPQAEVIELMGDKIRSREFVAKLGLPVPPSLSMNVNEVGFIEAATAMGFPLVVKASAGGGGKGMGIVRSADDLAIKLQVAASEAERYFGDSRIYVERYFDNTRHIEVQVLGDGENVIHLGERDCSIQRRFQKIIEESPSPALSVERRAALCEVAVAIASAANYRNAGTVEFLYTPEGEFFFLEMNTRIQVEHPVTEMVTGIDLVKEQIKLAAGQTLLLTQADILPQGCAIECRICAEDAFNDFLPEVGKVLFVKEPSGDNLRFDSGLYQGQTVSTAYDPMLAKLVAYGSTREQAIAKILEALRTFVLLGVKSNTNFLTKVLSHSRFVEGNFNTNFITQYKTAFTEDELTLSQAQTLLSAAALSDTATRALMEVTPQPYRAIGRWSN
ncbi:MAG: ATP-grasp domain-containing protein [Gammaproteobacteria bacterium]|nr:ATP-grasp domain-containing protein [Gammaproteobacteria bacterium]